MLFAHSQPLSIVLFSANNPDATYLTAGLLHHRAAVRQITIQNVDPPQPSPSVLLVLQEGGNDIAAWHPDVIAAEVVRHVDVGITLCVPT